jgi:hypothetical protein
MNPELSKKILLGLIIFFGIFIFSGLLKYIGIYEGMSTNSSEQNVVTGTPVNVAQIYPSF